MPPALPEESTINPNTIAAYKRCISALEEENSELHTTDSNQPRGDKYHVSAGRAIRRLVTLADRVKDLVTEADKRAGAVDDSLEELSEE
ncbi:hypothetical protein PAXINDRAFT_11915 [Paxillus involutus ATCC 200175]|uniref:Uncharacterized protein n=1 Tax=Paxillus involutus ATCC 200175 TaxID=664439 RepID=A0A0C9U7G3_PAXIN|nr:hypothetical protein PAXINDRAFT_11915 [Paxillus involutus ATCC 200175]